MSIALRAAGRVLVGGVLVLVLLLMLAPFAWIVSTAFKNQVEVYAFPPQWWPPHPTLSNFATVLQQVPFAVFFGNSFLIAALTTLGQYVTCTLSAYAFARLKFPGRDALFGLFLASLMVPSQVTIIPLYILMRYLGWINTPWALVVPGSISAFGTFLLRQFFLQIPRELEEAARIDGAGPLRTLISVILPVSGAALATLGILTFNWQWNNFFGPLIFINSMSKMTLPLGLVILQGMYGGSSPALVLAGVVMALIPVFVIYLLGQRYLVEGITVTGLKGLSRRWRHVPRAHASPDAPRSLVAHGSRATPSARGR